MKLGTDTGSVVNHIFSRATIDQPIPEVGMGATILAWTDRYPATIATVEQPDSKVWQYIVGVQEDDAKRIDANGMSECQSYEYTRRPDAPIKTFGFHIRRQEWMGVRKSPSGRWVLMNGDGLRIGERDKYHDFSF